MAPTGRGPATCRALRGLDGRRYRPDVIRAVQASGGHRDSSHPGGIVRSADGESRPGHLFLSSEDRDYVLATRAGLRIPVPDVDRTG